MAEDPERQRRRQYLLREREKLSKAQEWLSSAKKEDGFNDHTGETESVFGMRLTTPSYVKEECNLS